MKTWFSQRRTFLQSQLATVAAPFSVSGVVVTNDTALVSGTAPIQVQSVWFNGAKWPVTWTGVNTWTATVPLRFGTNVFNVVGVDPKNQPVSGATNSLSAVYNGSLPSPVGQVVLNEIMYAPLVTNSQYVELFNNSSNTTFDLSGWQVHGLGYTFPAGSLLAPNGFLVLAANREDYAGAYGATNLVFDTFDGTLQPTGETLALVVPGTNSASDLTVAKVRFSNAAPWPVGANATGGSLQLIDPRQDNWRVGNWSGTNPPVARTPGATNSVWTTLPAFASLWLNELQPDNLTGLTNSAGTRAAWLELYNPSSNIVSLNGLYLANAYTNLTTWAFPVGAVINPGQFKVVFTDGQTNLSTLNELHTSFTLAKGAGSLALSRLYNSKPLVLDYIDYTNLAPNHSYGSYPDGQSFTRSEFFYVTPGGTNNGSSAPLTVKINEWMANNNHTIANPSGSKNKDWFELYNYGSNTVDLAGYYLTDTLSNQFQFQIPIGYSIPPHGFLLVWADGQSLTGTPDLHVNFKLNKNGESIGLYGADGSPVDYVTYDTLQAEDVSMGRYPDGANGIFYMPTGTPRTNNVIPNTAPVLDPIGTQSVTLGQTLTFRATASDSDQPAQTLTFSLDAGAAGNAAIDAVSGLFTWMPTIAPSTNAFSVIVKDNGSPSLSSTQTFSVIVYLPPTVKLQLNGDQTQLAWPRGTLQQSDDVAGPYTDVPGATAPYDVIPSATMKFFRIRM